MASPLETSFLLKLPDELILQILRCARASTTLWEHINILLTCKRFHTVGRSAAFEILLLTNEYFDDWVHSSKYIGAQYFDVKHMTVNLSGDVHYKLCDCETEKHHDYGCGSRCTGRLARDATEVIDQIDLQLKALVRVLKTHLRNLLTFALTIDFEPISGVWCACLTSHISSSSTARVLKCLPLSCESLLLDTRGCEKSHDKHSIRDGFKCDLCAAIVSCMASLKHIWLRTVSLCTWFMNPKHLRLPSHFLLATPYESWFPEHYFSSQDYVMNESEISGYYFGGEYKDLWWKAWNNADNETRSEYIMAAMVDQMEVEKAAECLSFPYLVSLTINLCVFPAPSWTVEDDAAKKSHAISIAREAWGSFPALMNCIVVAQHRETVDSREFLNLEERNDERLPDPCFNPFSEVFVWDILKKTTAVLPFRFLTPEGGLRMEHIRTQKVYAFYDLATKKQHFGSFGNFDHILKRQLPGGWVTSAGSGMMFPKTVASQILGFEEKDAYSGCLSREVMEQEILGSGDILPLWVDRAYAARALKSNGILNSFQIRDTITGALGTQGQYQMRELPDDEL